MTEGVNEKATEIPVAFFILIFTAMQTLGSFLEGAGEYNEPEGVIAIHERYAFNSLHYALAYQLLFQ